MFSLPELGSILKGDCKHAGVVVEFWWQTPQSSDEFRRIMGDREVFDMVSKLSKSKIVHRYAVDPKLDDSIIPLVTHWFVDQIVSMTPSTRK